MKSDKIHFAGIAGVIVFLFGVIGAFIVGFQGAGIILPAVHLCIGAGLVIFWFFAHGLSHWRGTSEVVRGRTARFSVNAITYITLFLGVIIAANYLATRHDKRLDLTEEGIYSIAEQSKTVIKNLQASLKVAVFKVASGPEPERIKDLLNLYKNANPSKFSFEIIDPQAKPHLVEKYGMKTGSFIYLEYGDTDPKAISRLNDFSEEALTNAIIKLSKGDEKKLYYVQGHGEPDIKSNKPGGFEEFSNAITDEHMKLEPLVLATSDKIPDDAAAIILNSPRKSFVSQEKEMLIKYVDAGGRLFIAYDPQVSNPEIKEIASHFGIILGNDIIVDMVQRLFAGPALGVQPIVPLNGTHKILERFGEGDVAIFNMTSSVRVDETNQDAKKNCQELIKTGPNSWAETNLKALLDAENPSASRDPDDITGPVSVAVVCEKSLEKAKAEGAEPSFDKVSRVVVVGDSDWFANGNITQYSARDLVLNIVNWLAGEEGGISIRPKQMRFSAAPIERSQYMLIFLGSYVIPELILLAGLYVWWRSRNAN